MVGSGLGGGEVGEDDEVVLVAAGSPVVGPVARDEPQRRTGYRPVGRLGREVRLGEAVEPVDREAHL